MPAQRPAGVPIAEEPAALQLGHHQADDVFVGARRVCGGDDESVAGAGPSNHSSIWSAMSGPVPRTRPLQQDPPVSGQVAQRHRVAADVRP